MANFIFDEGANLMATGGLDWAVADYEIVLYQNTVPAFNSSASWSTFDAHIPINGVGALASKTITPTGGCASDPLKLADVQLVAPATSLPGVVIKRASDDLLICHIDEGIEGITSFSSGSGGAAGNILGVMTSPDSYTFWLIPDSQNRSAWFRP